MLWAQSTTKDYIRAEHKLQSPSYLFRKSSYHKSCLFSLFIFRWHSARDPASSRVTYLFCRPTQELAFSRVTYFILQAYTGTCIQQGDLFYSAGLHRNLHPAGWPILFCRPVQESALATANTGQIGRGLGKNAGEWTGRVETSKEKIPGSKRSMYGYILTHSRL